MVKENIWIIINLLSGFAGTFSEGGQGGSLPEFWYAERGAATGGQRLPLPSPPAAERGRRGGCLLSVLLAPGGDAAIHRQDHARDPRCLVGGEEQDRLGHVAR